MTKAISFDFFNTLAKHPGAGRGTRLIEYFRTQGWTSDPWEHQVLYDVFREHGMSYEPAAPAERHADFCRGFAESVYKRLNVQRGGAAAEHALAVFDILGPKSLAPFPDVEPALESLGRAGYPLIVISNWQRGLTAFCTTLKLADHFDHIISSDEVGFAKPDPRIFEEACRRLGVSADQVLHIGDSMTDDYEGARAAGMKPLLVARAHDAPPPPDVSHVPPLDAHAILRVARG